MKHLIALLALAIACTVTGTDLVDPLIFDVTSTKTEWKTEQFRGEPREKRNTVYDIEITNTGTNELKDLEIDYCVYRYKKYLGEESSPLWSYRIQVETILPQQAFRKTIKVKGFQKEKEDFIHTTVGARFRLYDTTSEPRTLLRTINSPPDLSSKYQWQDYEDTKKNLETKSSKPASDNLHKIQNADKWKLTEPQRTAMKQAAEFKMFTTSEGEKLFGLPADFETDTKSVELYLKDGSERTVVLATLSEQDQTFIEDWLTGYSLITDNTVRITTRKKTNPDQLYSGKEEKWDTLFPDVEYRADLKIGGLKDTYDDIHYEFHIENRTEKPIADIIVEYCIYHQTIIQEEFKKCIFQGPYWHSSRDDKYEDLPEKTIEKYVTETLLFRNIAAGEKISLSTDSVKVTEDIELSYYPIRPKIGAEGTRNKRTIKGKLLGIRYRVYLPTQAGNYSMLEDSSPSSLIRKTEWPTDNITQEKPTSEEKARVVLSSETENSAEANPKNILSLTPTEHKVFRLIDGSEIIASPLKFDEQSEVIELILSDNSHRNITYSKFSIEDKKYIQDWHIADTLLKQLRINIHEQDEETSFANINFHRDMYDHFPNIYKHNFNSNNRSVPGYRNFDLTSTKYTFGIKNRSSKSLTSMRIEYCIYHRANIEETSQPGRFYTDTSHTGQAFQNWAPTGKKTKSERVAIDTTEGVLIINELASRETFTGTTEHRCSFDEHKDNCKIGTTEIRRNIDSELLGIRYRIYLPTPNGNYAMMEFAEPKKLLKETEWPEE